MKLKAIIAATLGAFMALGSTARAETTINYNIFVPPSHFMWDVMRDWAGQVEEKSGGSLKVAFTAKSVAPPPKILDAVRNGSADAGFMANVFSQKFAPGTGVSMQPWIHRGDASAAGVALWRVYNKHFIQHDNWKGVELLGLFQFANANICSVDGAPLNNVQALKERKVWALPGTTTALMQSLEISVSSGPAVQIQELVSRNVVDAFAGMTYDAIDKFGAGPYTKYCIDFEAAPTSTNFSHFISSRMWDSLSEEEKKVLRDLSGEHLATMVGKAIDAEQAKSKEKLMTEGLTVQAPSAELLAGLEKASEPVIAAWVKSVESYGVDATGALEEVRALTRQLTEENASK